jgi:hypothetical protein
VGSFSIFPIGTYAASSNFHQPRDTTPDILERILDGRPDRRLPQLLKPFPVEWENQRERFC